ncbi:unnamed protein product [Symbiodinium sp. CCMP2592]|nr:unnamed protein product [Symbiodinium sp. CCMP2592]
MDEILHDTWKIMSSILQEAVHAETITGVMVDRVAQLSHKVLMDLDIVVHQTEQAAYSSSHSSDAYLVELASQQEMLLFKMSVEASLVLYGIQVHENWLELNASRATFAATHTMLLHGTEATNSTPQLPKQRDVCMLSRMREVGDAFAQLEQSALNVAFGNRSELEELAALSSGALVKTESMADALLHGFSSCDNSTQLLPVDQWLALHQSAAAVAQWTLRATCTSLLQDHGRGEANLEAHIAKLDGAFQRLLFGSFSPRVPAPPSQVLLDDIFATVSPAMSSFKDAVGAQDMLRLVAAGDSLRQGAEEAQARYLREAQLQHPAWPGPRVDVVTRAMTEASTVFLAALREVSQRSGAGELEAAVAKFERLHRQAKEGGGGLEPVPVARKDISEQWDRVDQAWDAFRDQVLNAASEDLWRAEESLEGLLAELSASVSLYSQEDEEQVAGFPYTTPGENCTFWCYAVRV